MRSPAVLALIVVLLGVTTGLKYPGDGLWLRKCCDVHEMLSAQGESCVEAPWPCITSIESWQGYVFPPLDREWLRRWLPPGLPLQDIGVVLLPSIPLLNSYINNTASSVNASSLWDPALLQNEHLPRDTIAFVGKHYIARPKPGGGYRDAFYCVDAAPPPLGPFAMRINTLCKLNECAYKCCRTGQLMKKNDTGEGHWQCVEDDQGHWTPSKSFFKDVFDPEFPQRNDRYSKHLRLSPFGDQYAPLVAHADALVQFQFSTFEACFDFYRSNNGSIHEGLFYNEYPRITRGVYWLLRPLCVLSALLLLASLISIASNKSMRRTIHGRCLASHAICLLAFNIGQIGYYVAISDRLDKEEKSVLPPDREVVCKNFALLMYFLMTSAWFWLSALCANMARGFKLQMARSNRGSRRTFLTISAFALGPPAVLTITCSILFTQPKMWHSPPWYTPSLMETRVCYIEPLYYSSNFDQIAPFMKSGTAVYYYGPMSCLVACNVICIVMTLRKVQYLRRGNSVLRRQENQIPLGQRHTEANNTPTTPTVTNDGKRNRTSISVDAKTIKLYIKMILMTGGIELLSEVIMWFITHDNFTRHAFGYANARHDRDLAYRAAGYVTDFFRAAVVTWLAAPEGGYLGLVRRLHRGKEEKKPAGAADADRRKQNVA